MSLDLTVIAERLEVWREYIRKRPKVKTADQLQTGLRISLIKNRGNLGLVARDLEVTLVELEVEIMSRELNLDNYRYLAQPVPQYGPEVKKASPYVPEGAAFLVDVTKKDLNELGWRLNCLEGMEIWEKGAAHTGMSARVIIDYNNDYYHLVALQLYDPDNRLMEGVWGVKVFLVLPYHFSGKAVDERKRLAFGIAESYLSGATNIKDIQRIFNRFRIRDRLGDVVARAVGQLRTYLSGGIVDPSEFDGSSELIRKYGLSESQVVYLRDGYARLYGLPLIGFQKFIDWVMENPGLVNKVYRIK